jgi:hypothetical protein
LLLGILVPYNQHVVRDRIVAGHVALRGWLATRLDDRLGAHTDPQELARRMILGTGDSRRESAGLHLSGIQEAEK